MVRRVRRMSGGLRSRFAMAVFAIALLTVAFCLVFWMYFRNKSKEELYLSRISELEEQLVTVNNIQEEIPEMAEIKKSEEWIREIEYSNISLSSNLSEGDYADIRLRYPDGSDYVVAVHKRIAGLDREKGSVMLSVCEEELLMLSSAIRDLLVYPGARLYAARYTEAKDEALSVADYIPSAGIIRKLEKDKNILERSTFCTQADRAELEEGLKDCYYGEIGDYTETPVEYVEDLGGSIWD